MRDTLLIIHILAAATWIGGSMAVAYLSGPMRKKGSDVGAGFMSGFEQMGRSYYPPTVVVLLVTGILLVLDSSVYEFQNGFVIVGIASVIVGILLGTKVFAPLAKSAVRAHNDADATAVARTYRRFRAFGVLDLAILVFAVFAMVTKLGV